MAPLLHGWRLCFTDGAFASRMAPLLHGWQRERRLGSKWRLQPRRYWGPQQKEPRPMIAIASDSMAAIHTVWNLSKGTPPRFHIERRIKDILASPEKDVGILWTRGHVGIHGNEEADKRPEFQALLGEIQGATQTGIEEGLRALGKALRKEARHEPGFGQRRTSWDRHALSAFTSLRTDKGPKKKWLHHIGKADNPACTCGHSPEDGWHITFECPRFHEWRAEYLGERRTWEELDKQVWVKRGEGDSEEIFEGTEAFFGLIYSRLRAQG